MTLQPARMIIFNAKLTHQKYISLLSFTSCDILRMQSTSYNNFINKSKITGARNKSSNSIIGWENEMMQDPILQFFICHLTFDKGQSFVSSAPFFSGKLYVGIFTILEVVRRSKSNRNIEAERDDGHGELLVHVSILHLVDFTGMHLVFVWSVLDEAWKAEKEAKNSRNWRSSPFFVSWECFECQQDPIFGCQSSNKGCSIDPWFSFLCLPSIWLLEEDLWYLLISTLLCFTNN